MELQVGELEHELFQRLGLRLRCEANIRGEPFAECDENRVQSRVDAAGGAAHGNVNRFLAEELFQHAELRAIQGKGDDGERIPPTLFLHVERMAQLLADPLGLERVRADHDRVGRRALNGLLNFRPKRIPAAQLARIDPHVLIEVAEGLLQVTHEAVVARAVRKKEAGHAGVMRGFHRRFQSAASRVTSR